MEKVMYKGVDCVSVPAYLVKGELRKHFNLSDDQEIIVSLSEYNNICKGLLEKAMEHMFQMYWASHAKDEKEFNEVMLEHDERLRSNTNMPMHDMLIELDMFMYEVLSEDSHEE